MIRHRAAQATKLVSLLSPLRLLVKCPAIALLCAPLCLPRPPPHDPGGLTTAMKWSPGHNNTTTEGAHILGNRGHKNLATKASCLCLAQSFAARRDGATGSSMGIIMDMRVCVSQPSGVACSFPLAGHQQVWGLSQIAQMDGIR